MEKVPRKEYINIVIAIAACFVSVYLVPTVINRIFFIAILFIAFVSKKDYFWLAVFFIITCTPGSLFFGSSGEVVHRLPLYKIGPGVSFSVLDLFLVMTTFKALFARKPNKMILNSYFMALGFMYVVYLVYSFMIGMSTDNVITVLRHTFLFSLLFSIPRLLPKPSDMYKFAHLIFPFISLVLLGEFTQILFASRLIDPWVGKETNTNYALSKGITEQYTRPNDYGSMLTYFSIIFGLYYFARKDTPTNKTYLLIIIIASFASHVISQTRGWISATSFIIILYFIFIQGFRAKYIAHFMVGLFIFYMIYASVTPLKISIDNGIARFTSVENFAKGDITAGGTNIRYSERLPKVLEGAKINPFFGLGFSDEYWKYADYHVGFATMFVQIGVVGYLVFLAFWIKFYHLFARSNSILLYRNPMRRAILIFPIALSASLLLHFTAYQFMGFEFMLPPDYFYICILFTFADNALKESRLINNYLVNQQNLEYKKSKMVLQPLNSNS